MSMFWFAARDSACLLLVIWTAAIAVFADSDMVRRFLWLPVSLGFAGLMGAIFILALPANVILIANLVTLVLFVVSFEILKQRQHSRLLPVRHRGR